MARGQRTDEIKGYIRGDMMERIKLEYCSLCNFRLDGYAITIPAPKISIFETNELKFCRRCAKHVYNSLRDRL